MGNVARYPYHLWADGEWHEIHPSEWNKSIASLRASLQQWGKANNKRLTSRTVDADTLAISFRRAA